MAIVFSANQSEVRVGNELILGVRSIEYRSQRARREVTALGTDERIAVYYGAKTVVGTIRVASTSPVLDHLLAEPEAFQIVATLAHGETRRSVAFDECWMDGKSFAIDDGGHGETLYSFSSTRVREEDA